MCCGVLLTEAAAAGAAEGDGAPGPAAPPDTLHLHRDGRPRGAALEDRRERLPAHQRVGTQARAPPPHEAVGRSYAGQYANYLVYIGR